jgi:hypothetical protein
MDVSIQMFADVRWVGFHPHKKLCFVNTAPGLDVSYMKPMYKRSSFLRLFVSDDEKRRMTLAAPGRSG